MSQYEGNVSLVANKENVLEIKPRVDGRWNSSNVAELLREMAKLPKDMRISNWSFWLDVAGMPDLDKKPIKVAQFLAYAKTVDTVELVLVKRPFPQPKLKLTKGEGKGGKRAAASRVIL